MIYSNVFFLQCLTDHPDILSPPLQAAIKSPSQAMIRCRPDVSASLSGGLRLSLTGPLLHTAASDLSTTGLLLGPVPFLSTAKLGHDARDNVHYILRFFAALLLPFLLDILDDPTTMPSTSCAAAMLWCLILVWPQPLQIMCLQPSW